jgi:hypothetical protein
MSENTNKSAEIDNLNIEPLSDEDLESVAGGLVEGSCSCCTSNSGCTSGLAADVS